LQHRESALRPRFRRVIPVIPTIAVIPANAGIHFLSTAKSALTETFKPALFAADSVGKSAL